MQVVTSPSTVLITRRNQRHSSKGKRLPVINIRCLVSFLTTLKRLKVYCATKEVKLKTNITVERSVALTRTLEVPSSIIDSEMCYPNGFRGFPQSFQVPSGISLHTHEGCFTLYKS